MNVREVSLFSLLVLALSQSSGVAADTINGAVMRPASVDKILRLKKLFLFPTVDDLSGVLSPQLDQQLQDSFKKDPRFEVVRDSSVIRALSPDEAAYAKVAQNESIHKEAAKITGTDATIVLRTKTSGGSLSMTLEWRGSDGKVLFSEVASMPGFSSVDAQKSAADSLVSATIKKIPFMGTVTGKAGKTLTIDLGSLVVRNGDILDIARLVSIQRHPLLGTLVGVDHVNVARVRITTADRVLSFAEIVEEAPGESALVDNKVVLIKKGERLSEKKRTPREDMFEIKKERDPREEETEPSETDKLTGEFEKSRARYGSAGVSLLVGSLGQVQTVNGVAADYSGTGLGAALDGELWVTKEWIAALDYSFLSSNLSGTRASADATLGDTTWNKLSASGGYRLFTEGRGDGLSVLFAGGYQRVSMVLPANAALDSGEKTFSGIFVKVEGDLPINAKNKVLVGVEFQPFSTFEESGFSGGSESGANSVGFKLRWLSSLGANLWGRLGLDFDSSTGSYSGGGSATSKRLTISPGISYNF